MMRYSFARRSRLAGVVALSLLATGAGGGLGGCESGGLGGMLGGSSALEALSPAIKDAANSYLGNLTSLTDAMKNIRGYQDAINFAQKAEPMVSQLSSSYQTLSATGGTDRSNLLAAFGPKFDKANSGFTSQLGQLKGSSTAGSIAGPVLDRVRLFK
ncbi:MAG: hypothetical protein K2Q20_13170 [Phycisphaerales bacterium]|nr:hypothetical protein [Phycisphaerales bacterium]